MTHFACPSFTKALVLVPMSLLAGTTLVMGQYDSTDHRATEIYSPVPPVVTPATNVGAPPSDAIVLFDGKNEDAWVKVADGSPADWIVAGGILTVNKKSGHIQTQ